MYEYAAKLIRVIDGDTVDLDIDLGFHIHRIERVRVAGIDTPELHSSDPLARASAQSAKLFVETELADATIVVRTEKPDPRDKYGRYLANILYCHIDEWRSLSEGLLKEGLAKPYSGGAR